MKVHYKDSIVNQLHAITLEAKNIAKRVDYIELTREEWDELVLCAYVEEAPGLVLAYTGEFYYNGITIKLGKD